MQLPESANLVRNGLKIVLLEVKDPQFTELANTCKENCVTYVIIQFLVKLAVLLCSTHKTTREAIIKVDEEF